MTISAIICEFNPLHTGHKKIIDCAKSVSDKVICIMSGNFTQRGLPACADKYSRALHAIKAGADMVVELPTVFASSSAQDFAYGGIKIAEILNADYLVFGSECGNLEELKELSELLSNPIVNDRIKAEMKKGAAYPKAVANAVNSPLLDYPNNALAIEYLQSLKRLNSKITPLTVLRENNYSSTQTGEYASSTALRANPRLRGEFTYDYVTADINDNIENKFKEYAAVAASLLNKDFWSGIDGVSEGIENRFISADKSKGYEELMNQVKTKRFTRAKLQRILLRAILCVTKYDFQLAKEETPEILPLAVKKESADLLQYTNGKISEVTARADNLYYALGGKTPPVKLIKI